MKKLDRLGWADGFSVSPHGTTLGVRVNVEDKTELLLDEISSLGWKPIDTQEVDMLYSFRFGKERKAGRRDFHLVYFGITRLARETDLEPALSTFRLHIRRLVAMLANDAVFVPGAVLSWEGRQLILPSGSGQGKSTLIRGLRALSAVSKFAAGATSLKGRRGEVGQAVNYLVRKLKSL